MMNQSSESELPSRRRREKQKNAERTVSKRWVEHRETASGKQTRRVVSRTKVSVKVTVVETWGDVVNEMGSANLSDRPATGSGRTMWDELPARWKLSLSHVLHPNGTAAREMDGDYILDRIYCDVKQARWEHTFPAQHGLFRASLMAVAVQNGDVQLTAELSGLVTGFRWQGIVRAWCRSFVLPAIEKDREFAGLRWPSTVELMPLFLGTSGSMSWSPSAVMGSEFCGSECHEFMAGSVEPAQLTQKWKI